MTRRSNTMTLVAVASAVPCARIFVATTLRRWGLPNLIDVAELLASELTTNAVTATGVLDPQVKPHELHAPNKVIVRIEERSGSLFVSVWDCDPSLPVIEARDLEEESGRGLVLVSALSKRWSCYPAPNGGKVVWIELAPPSPPTTAGLPRRTRSVCPFVPLGSMRDRATLLRVLNALASL